ncbi:MAG: 50S ribosomal protein L3 N(5)-glutamine methyltransferase [Gammaproteobacteria bacterium]|nr:50S ribosomal protein L3 N(5)-glutamine methyltransferase [Gammaproteobacteria bacterium]
MISDNKMITLQALLQWGGEYLAAADLCYGHGTDNANDEAAWLLLFALDLPVDEPIAEPERLLSGAEVAKVKALLKRRAEERLPAAYLTRQAWFAGLSFYVDERVLVPRSPLAEPILSGFADWLDPAGVERVLDLCSGSGCIGIACAYAFADAQVDLADISAEALEVAQINIEQHELSGRVKVQQADLFVGLEDRRYDLIVSNPPYVDAIEMSQLSQEFRHEPELGLAAGELGLDLVQRMLRQAGDFLNDHGMLVVEVGNSAQALEAFYPEVPFLWLQFEYGGEGVFMLTADELKQYQGYF